MKKRISRKPNSEILIKSEGGGGLASYYSKEYRNLLISTNYGERTLQIASRKVDSLRTKGEIRNIINNTNTGDIDIERIQETHNGSIDSIRMYNYAIFFGGSISRNANTTLGNRRYFPPLLIMR